MTDFSSVERGLPDWPVSAPVALEHAEIRSSSADFRVQEIPPCEPVGRGEHLWLLIEKTGLNTAQVLDRLSALASLHPRNISFAGMKDRHAVTSQWFSLHLPGKPDPDLAALESDDLTVLRAERHDRKLQRGALKGNRFELILRQCKGERGHVEARLAEISRVGVPDYFGEQRFGRGASNVRQFDQVVSGNLPRAKEKRGILLSSVRSWLFNQVLAERVRTGSWDSLLDGDVVMLAGSHSVFVADASDESLHARIREADIHATGPMPGEGGVQPDSVAAQLEQWVLAPEQALVDGLCRQGLKALRRPLRVMPEELRWVWLDESTLSLSFTLPPGAYATAVLRELANYVDLRGGQALRDDLSNT